jgi:hypothetical protein
MDPFALAHSARQQIGRQLAETSTGPLALARWSAGAAVATLALANIVGHGRPAEGLFASLNQDARDVLECLSRLPVMVPLAVVLVSL